MFTLTPSSFSPFFPLSRASGFEIASMFFLFLVAIGCGPLTNPANGAIELSGTAFGDTATYSCNQGFVLFGKGIRTCEGNGQWNGKSPECRGEI